MTGVGSIQIWRQRIRRHKWQWFPLPQLKKCDTTPAFHSRCGAIAANMVDFKHIPRKMNPADILSEHWSHNSVFPMLKPLLFCSGDAPDLIEWLIT